MPSAFLVARTLSAPLTSYMQFDVCFSGSLYIATIWCTTLIHHRVLYHHTTIVQLQQYCISSLFFGWIIDVCSSKDWRSDLLMNHAYALMCWIKSFKYGSTIYDIWELMKLLITAGRIGVVVRVNTSVVVCSYYQYLSITYTVNGWCIDA